MSILLCVAGVVSIGGGWCARDRVNPTEVSWEGMAFRIDHRVEGEAEYHDFVSNGVVALTLAASLDTLCDPSQLVLIDVDNDGRLDVYHRHCGGHGYVKFSTVGRQIKYIDLGTVERGDAPGTEGCWGDEIMVWRGLRLLGIGAAALFAGTIMTAILLLAFRRHSKSRVPPNGGTQWNPVAGSRTEGPKRR